MVALLFQTGVPQFMLSTCWFYYSANNLQRIVYLLLFVGVRPSGGAGSI